jgi:hypothetical protein
MGLNVILLIADLLALKKFKRNIKINVAKNSN